MKPPLTPRIALYEMIEQLHGESATLEQSRHGAIVLLAVDKDGVRLAEANGVTEGDAIVRLAYALGRADALRSMGLSPDQQPEPTQQPTAQKHRTTTEG